MHKNAVLKKQCYKYFDPLQNSMITVLYMYPAKEF